MEPTSDRFLNEQNTFNRLLEEYNKHQSLFIGFDFDNTIFDYQGNGDTYPEMIKLLHELVSINCKLILFTCREGIELTEAVTYCKSVGIVPDYVNESPLYRTRKPFFNLLLDDRAGLSFTYDLCKMLIHKVKSNGS
jgi:hypothetical protein